MDVEDRSGDAVSRIAAAIGEPARARMLYYLMDGQARTSTELALAADVSPSTASVHLSRLKAEKLLEARAQGKHRYYRLAGRNVGAALESLSVLAGVSGEKFAPRTPYYLRAARTCYDHIAGALGVLLHDRFSALGWLRHSSTGVQYEVTASGEKSFQLMGIDIEHARKARRRFAFGCLDWSERRPHMGGALGAEILRVALEKRWITRELDSRALAITSRGKREMRARFGLRV